MLGKQSQLSDSVELQANSKSFSLLKPLKGRVRSLAINPAHSWVVTGHCHHSSAFEGKLEPVKKDRVCYHFLFFLGRLNKSTPRWELLDFVLSSNIDCWKCCVAVGHVFSLVHAGSRVSRGLVHPRTPLIVAVLKVFHPSGDTDRCCTIISGFLFQSSIQ